MTSASAPNAAVHGAPSLAPTSQLHPPSLPPPPPPPWPPPAPELAPLVGIWPVAVLDVIEPVDALVLALLLDIGL